jgi:hypothetical protein
MPLAALLARAALWLLHRREANAGLHGHGALRYALLVAPTAVPLAWFISACLHQAESGTGPGVCAVPDPPGVMCPEVAFFAGALVLLVAFTALPRLIREQRALRPSSSPEAVAARAHLEALIENHDDLKPLAGRLIVTDRSAEPIATLGVFAPRLVIHTSFVRDLDDEALLGALKHEAEHVRDRDPLRYFIAWWALAANPIGGWLLRSEFTRWVVARETHCDRDAVLAGASAPALAQALVSAARFPTQAAPSIALRAPNASVLRLRIGLLMAYADRPPSHCCRTPALRFVICALALAVALPHQFGADALDTLHTAAEDAASALLPDQD